MDNSEHLTDTYHILGKKKTSNKTYLNSVHKKFGKMFTLLLYQVKMYYLK